MNLLERLEPRTLCSAGPFNFTDGDGDTYTVELTGRGTAAVTQTAWGGIRSIALQGTNKYSRLFIDVTGGDGDGLVNLRRLTGHTLRAIIAPDVDLIGKVRLSGSLPGRLDVDGLFGATVRVAGDVGHVTAGAAYDSLIFAGIDPRETGLPNRRADFVRRSRIASITVRGPQGFYWLDNANAAAWTIGQVDTGFADPDNGGRKYGIATHAIGHYQYVNDQGTTSVAHPERTGARFSDGDAIVRFF